MVKMIKPTRNYRNILKPIEYEHAIESNLDNKLQKFI